MTDGEVKRTHLWASAAVLLVIALVGAVFTVLGYTAAYKSTETITVMSPRAGLVLDKEAKVKFRDIQIGEVKEITYTGEQAKLRLAIDSKQLPYVPSNAKVQIVSNTIFGAKSVVFVPPDSPEGPLKPGSTVQVSEVQLEVNTLFQKLIDLLRKIDPVHLNATLSALGEGLRGNGEDLGAMLTGLNSYLGKMNPSLPTLQDDFAKAATVANIYADAAPDLARVFDNMPAVGETIIDQQDNLNATLLAATGLANTAYDTLEPAAEDLIAAIQRVRAPAKLLGDYSPEIGCLLKGIALAADKFGPIIGGIRPGLYVDSNFLPGSPAYTYPESLPIVNASGGPNCRGLPDMPSKQFGGTWYRAPFLVTDNAYVPYQPNTELQFDAPSTLQFLFNGAFAERDDF
jgi:phospholipid/cholesterol/gamma-HCH transport system substrate-binding protein